MSALYNFTIFTLASMIRLAGLVHPKARSFVTGRRNLLKVLSEKFQGNTDKVVWVHCASLGEFEQGRPIIESLHNEFPHHRILVTFFSPSGYEVRKNYERAYFVTYLPLDTPRNARRFIEIVRPSIAIFVKYEFWYNFSRELRKNRIPLISSSSIFRSNQMFFTFVGSFYKKVLMNFSFFFVQNAESERLLRALGIDQVAVAGDTRFDRVYQIALKNEEIPVARQFKGEKKVMVVGSAWGQDMEVLIPFINESRLKFIVAFHEISESVMQATEGALQVRSIRYSRATTGDNLEDYQVLIIDNVGMLSKLYRYGEFAFVGGAFGKGLHNILEAACYGIPVFFGNKNYEKFREAVDLISRGGAFDVRDFPDLKAKFEMLKMTENYHLATEVTRQYVAENLGATKMITDYCTKFLV